MASDEEDTDKFSDIVSTRDSKRGGVRGVGVRAVGRPIPQSLIPGDCAPAPEDRFLVEEQRENGV